MIKILNDSNIDELMDFWKNESLKLDKSFRSKEMNDKYNTKKEIFALNRNRTTIYTEDESICGYVTVDEENAKILGILVKSTIRREGIGSVLIQNCKKSYARLVVDIPKNNKIARLFFEKNGFTDVDTSEEGYICMEWSKCKQSNIKLVYFDDDIKKEYLNEYLKIPYERIDVKKIIEECKIQNLEVYSIKSYMKFRKKIEDLMNTPNILLYIDYRNYYKFLDDQIKEIAKIRRINLNILICEPFTIENSKKDDIIREIEKSYQKYNITKIDCSLNNYTEDVALNQIFDKRMEILSKRIQEIAQNIQ